MADFQWAFWALGGMLGSAGVLLVALSLFWDTPRGRLRCPRCWYDMSGLEHGSLTCPECGRTQKDQARLRRTRRCRSRAVAGLALMILGMGTAFTPHLIRDDLVALVPSFAMRLVLPMLNQTAASEYDARVAGNNLPGKNVDRETWNDHLVAWGAANTLRAPVTSGGVVTRQIRGSTFDVPISSHSRALRVLAELGSESRTARPELLEVLRNARATFSLRQEAFDVLVATQETEQTVSQLEHIAEKETSPESCFAIKMLLSMGEDAVPAVRRMLVDGDYEKRELIGAVLRNTRSGYHMPLIVEALADVETPFSLNLYTCALLNYAAARSALARLEESETDAIRRTRITFLKGIVSRGVSREAAINALGDPDREVRILVVRYMRHMRVDRTLLLVPFLSSLEREADPAVIREMTDLLAAWDAAGLREGGGEVP